MSLTLVLGPANSAKAGEVLGAYRARAGDGALLVVPTAADARHYGHELAREGAALGGAVVTFRGLIREVARRVGLTERPLSALQQERLVKRVVATAPLQTLAPSASGAGFARAARDLIVELERSLVTPQRFSQALAAWSAEDGERRRFADEVASIYLRYHRELERLQRVDAELQAWRTLDALRAAPGTWGAVPVFLYGFDDLHRLERDAVETLARIVEADVIVSLTYEPGRAALAARAETVEELRPLATRVLELPPLADHYAPASRAALHQVERRLFEPTEERLHPGAAVQLLEAGGERAEVELVAAEVAALIRAGVPAGEIAVVYRSIDRPAALVERVFAAASIPVAGAFRVPLGRSALGRALLALARCALLPERQASAGDLLAYLRSPGLLEHAEVADALEHDVRRAGLATAAEARARLGWRLEEIDALRAAGNPLAELARHARRLFAAPRRGAAATLSDVEELDARTLSALVSALGELDELADAPAGADLIELLQGLTIPAGADARPGAVLLSDPLAIRARRFRVVFMCGLQENEFPLSGVSEPFLSDERRHELALASGLRLRPREDVLASERYLFYAAASRASERLYLSYRSSDEEGNLALPSPFISDGAELLDAGWSGRRRRRLLADVVWDLELAPTEREAARAQAAARGSGRRRVLAPERRTLSAEAMGHVRHREVVSAGALEAYADCPVKWLVDKELAPEPLAPDSDAVARGSYMHAALERLLARLGASVNEVTLADAKRILDEVLAELPASVAVGRPASVRRAALESIAADLRRYVAHEAASGAEWEIGGLELRFGFDDEDGVSLPALELGNEVRLRGVIDRVDVDGAGHGIVRDYKSGASRPEYCGARWQEERRLQVALYMVVVRQLLELEPVAGVYQPLGGRDLRARGVFRDDVKLGSGLVGTDARGREELDAVLDDALARARALADGLRGGELTPCPRTCSRDGCAYPGICWAER